MTKEHEVEHTKSPFKKYLYLGTAIIVLALVIFSIYQFIQIRNMFRQAREFSVKEQQFNQTVQKVQEQNSTCKTLISQQSGDFGEFEYCKRFVEWTNTLPFQAQ